MLEECLDERAMAVPHGDVERRRTRVPPVAVDRADPRLRCGRRPVAVAWSGPRPRGALREGGALKRGRHGRRQSGATRGEGDAVRDARSCAGGAGEPVGALDRTLLRILDVDAARAAELAGDRLVCRPGCDECCHGPFAITALDARRLERGLHALRWDDPARSRAVEARVEAAAESLSGSFPGDLETGFITGDEASTQRFMRRHSSVPCPALDPGTGTCDLYGYRPVMCRTFGPPSRVADEALPPCRLCFTDCAEDEIERSRVAFDADDVEGKILADLDDGGRETLVVWALRRAAGTREADG